MRRLALVLWFGWASASLATPQTTPPFMFGAPSAGNGLPGRQLGPKIATDGTDFLVVWRDYRRSQEFGDIYAARVTAAGTVLDPAGIPIVTVPSEQTDPLVVFDGTNYFIAWMDLRDSAAYAVYGTHVTPAGVVLAPNGQRYSEVGRNVYSFGMAAAPGRIALVYSAYNNADADLFASFIVSPSSGTAPGVLTSDVGDEFEPTVAWNGTNFLVTFEETTTGPASLLATRMSTTGTALDSPWLSIAGTPGKYISAASGSDGTDFLVAWQDSSAGNLDVYGRIVGAAGTLGAPVALFGGAADQSLPQISFASGNYVVSAWDYTVGAAAKRVSSTGVVIDTTPVVIDSNNADSPALACTGTTCLFSTAGDLYLDEEPHLRRMSPSLLELGTGLFSSFAATSAQWNPKGATDGKNFLVVWEEDFGGTQLLDVYAQLLGPSGAPIAAPFVVASGPGRQMRPTVDYAFGEYVVAYVEQNLPNNELRARRVGANGAFVDSSPTTLFVNNQIFSLDLSHDGQNFAWVAGADDGVASTNIYGGRMSPAGASLDLAPLEVCNAPNSQSTPALSFDGAKYTVVWSDRRGNGTADLYYRSWLPSGAFTGPDGGALLSTSFGGLETPQLSAGPAGSYVCWQDGTYPASVGGRLLQGDGALTSVTSFANTSNGESSCSVAWDGRQYWVAYEDFQDPTSSDLFGNVASTAGTLLYGATGVPLIGSPQGEGHPRLLPLAPGRVAMFYTSTDPAEDAGASRLFGVIARDLGPNGVACASGAECASGFCADGVCCQDACGGSDPTDCRACSVAMGAMTDGQCAFAAGYVCRPQADTCDVAEICTGGVASCPADMRNDDGGVCLALDGGPLPDSGTDAGCDGGSCARQSLHVGCGCSAGDAGAALFALFALVLAIKRSSSRSSAAC